MEKIAIILTEADKLRKALPLYPDHLRMDEFSWEFVVYARSARASDGLSWSSSCGLH
jgi:hypothetical protein